MKKKHKILGLSKETIASLTVWAGTEPESTLTPCTSYCATCIDVSQECDTV
ncbi:MAG TPA: hypothetical protein VHN15_14045 [Thermoanaerobaculia bacterium]|nr:hypothetical protein [Thermoanaerobaculia bacterium]